MKQRILIILLTLLTTMTVWADVSLVASPDNGGTIAFASDQDHNHLVVTPNPNFYIEKVIHEYSEGGSTGSQTSTPDAVTGYYYVNSTLGGTVTAYFKKADVHVSFNMNGHPNAANAPGNIDLAIDETVTRPTPVPTDGDYLVVGWYMDAACTTPYNFDTPLYNILNLITNKPHYDLTVYALWIKENCTVTFKANGGTGSMDAVTKAGGTEFEIPPCGFSFDGYHPYAGWGTSALGEVVYHPGDKITLTDDLTLYAKWSYPQTEFTLNGLKYESNSQISPTVSLTKYDGSKPTGDLVIPGSVTYGGTGYTVTTIGNGAFLGCTGLTSVTIPSSVKTIGDGAFRDCTGLTSVTIPEGVTTIGDYAFMGCIGLPSVTIPASVTSIGNDAFRGCTGLTSVTIADGVTTIDKYAFMGCTGLTSVTIFAPSLTKYGDLAFDSNATGRKFYVPSGSVGTYKDGWSRYDSDIEPLHYIIDEDKNVSILSNGTGKNVALKRSFAKGKKQTVCLPYAPEELLNYGKVWAFTGINGDKAVMTEIKEAASLKANTPYIFEASNDLMNITFPGVEISIGSDPKTVDGTAGFTFHGTYAEKIWEADAPEVTGGTIYGFMMKDNDGQTVGQFVKARRRTVLRPFSCYLEYSGGSLTGTASATRGEAQEPLPEVIDIVWLAAGDTGTATGIKEVKSEKYGVEGWFSLDGRRLSGKPSQKGLYIHNGTKVVIK